MTYTSIHFEDATRVSAHGFVSRGPQVCIHIEDRKPGEGGEYGTKLYLRGLADLNLLQRAIDDARHEYARAAAEQPLAEIGGEQ